MKRRKVRGMEKGEKELSPRGERPGGCGPEGSRPSAGGDRWEDTKTELQGRQMDGGGKRGGGGGGTVVGG